MTHRAGILAFLVTAAIGTATTVTEAEPLSRAQAVARAVAANPDVKLSLEQIALLDGRIVEARADALPDLSWWSHVSRTRDPSLLNSPNFDQFPPEFRTALRPIPSNMFDTYAAVQQTLFSFKLGGAIDAAKLARVAGVEDVRRARQTTALQAIQAYNQLLFAIEQLRVARTTVEQKQGHMDVARNRRTAGAATELEVLRAEVDLENQRAEVLRAEMQVTAARSLLNTIMLRPTDEPIEPTDALAATPASTTFDAAVAEALAARPELQSLKLEVQIRDKLIQVNRADMKPTFDFNGSYGFAVRDPANMFRIDFARWSAAVAIKVPLFDGQRTAGRVAQGMAERNIVVQRIAALENQVRLDVRSAWDSLQLAERTLAAADLNVTQARRAAEMTSANYRLGAATPLDVLDAQQALTLAENIRNQALLSQANSRASLSFMMGRDPLTDGPSTAAGQP
jgi:HAE1 family hydrophobic/amphiphilic exporter-1